MKSIYFLLALPLFIFSSFTLEAQTWTPPVTLGKTNSEASSLALDVKGNAVVVWTYTKAATSTIQAAKQFAGKAWSEPIILSNTSQQAQYANVSVDSKGNAMAVWSTTNTVQAAILSSQSSSDWTITSPIPAHKATSIVTPPRVAFDVNGNAFAVWAALKNDKYAIQAARYSKKKKSWKAVSEVDVSKILSLVLGLDPSGNAVILFLAVDEQSTIQSATLLSDSSEWILQAPLSHSSITQHLQLVVDNEGNATAAWWEVTPEIAIKAFSLPFKSNNWKKTTLPDTYAFCPNLAVDSSGTVMALYAGYGEDAPYTFKTTTLPRLKDKWTKPLTVLPASKSFIPYYQLAVDPNGNAIVMWGDHTKQQIQVSQLSSDKTWSDPISLAFLYSMEE